MACQTLSCDPDSARYWHLVNDVDRAEIQSLDNVTEEMNDVYSFIQAVR